MKNVIEELMICNFYFKVDQQWLHGSCVFYRWPISAMNEWYNLTFKRSFECSQNIKQNPQNPLKAIFSIRLAGQSKVQRDGVIGPSIFHRDVLPSTGTIETYFFIFSYLLLQQRSRGTVVNSNDSITCPSQVQAQNGPCPRSKD